MTTKRAGRQGRNVARTPARKLTFGVMLLLVTGCAECAPETVGTGVARLTIRNTGAIVSAINADKNCGFASDAVLANPTVEGEVGSSGSITWTVSECALDMGGGTELSKSCTGATTTAKGKVTVSATRTVTGVLTGNPASPVVPAGPDAVTIRLQKATFDNFIVEVSTSPNVLTMISGSVSAVVQPRLAVATSSGACAVSTPHAAFSEVTYGPSTLFVKTPDNEFEVDVATSALKAQNGSNGSVSNSVEGSITVFEESVTVPEEGDTGGLDPDYDAAKFEEGFACTPDLATPVSYVCGDLTPRLADGAARLSVKTFGTIVSMLDANNTCGFSADAVKGAATPAGTVGGEGSLTFTIKDCAVTLPANTELAADCTGAKTIAGGKITVSGTKVLSGRFTGNNAQPIVPDSDSPAQFDLTVTFEGFKVGSSADANALLVKSGTLAGKLSPRTALAAANGACAISSPIAKFEGLTWKDASLAVTSSSGTFDLQVASSLLNATNGAWEKTNDLNGSINIQGNNLVVPSDKLGLNPTYDQAIFDSAWQCAPGLVTPVSHSCKFVAPLGQGVARLTARTLGTVASMVDGNTTCGFKSAAVAGTPTFTGTVGKDDGTATFTITTPCAVQIPVETVISTDCSGAETRVVGTATVTGKKVVHGYRTGNPLNPVVPTRRDAAEFDLQVTFTDFTVKSSASTSFLTAKSGTLAGKVAPRLGLDKNTGACSISTPVVTFSDLTWTNASLRVVSDGSAFDVTANTSNLDAQNGTRDTVSNKLTGTITIDGAALPVPLPGTSDVLDPAFSQTAFDASYQCNPNLVVATSDAMCSFRQALGTNAARLLVKNVATGTRMLDGNTTCGFSAGSVLSAPTNVTGTAGNMGSITWTASACAMGPLPASTKIGTNCVGTETFASGTVTASATKTVNGMRQTNPPIIPLTRDAASFGITSMAFNGFELYDVPAGQTNPATRTTFSGTIATTVSPVAGESTANAGVFSVSTPVGRLTQLATGAGATAQLKVVSDGNTFELELKDVDLDAFAGTFNGASNEVSGTLTVDNIPVTIAAGTKLDPAFTQEAFDGTYVCTPDLKEVVPSN